MVVAAYGLPVALPRVYEMEWHWSGSSGFYRTATGQHRQIT